MSLPAYLTPPTPDELDAAERLALLDATIAYWRDGAVEALAALPDDGCVDKAGLRDVLDDVFRDATHEHRRRLIEIVEGTA